LEHIEQFAIFTFFTHPTLWCRLFNKPLAFNNTKIWIFYEHFNKFSALFSFSKKSVILSFHHVFFLYLP